VLSWDFLCDEAAVGPLLADEYARFRRPIAGALAVFLAGLPAAHQQAVLAAQAALPPAATAAERLAALARSCPVLHKLGQVLARDRRLSPELRRHLQELESLPPSVPPQVIRDALARELGPLRRLGVSLAPPALAEASVAVVVPFRRDPVPPGEGCRHGVFKLLKPGVEERLEQELEVLTRVGSFLDQRCDDFGIPHLDYRDSFEQVADKLGHEVRLDQERRHLTQARTLYEGDPRVQIPALLEPCTSRVTAMERVWGGKVTGHGPGPGYDRRRLAGLVVETLVARPVFSGPGPALIHGDPHAGNLLLAADGRLAVLDWSLVGWLGERERAAMVQVILGAMTYQPEHIVTTLAGLAGPCPDRGALGAAVRAALARVGRGQFPGFTWLMSLLDEAAGSARVRVGADLLVFRKALHTLEGVLADLGAGAQRIDEVLLSEFVRHLAVEWPWRWLAPPDCRAFASRLSNADLARVSLGLPWAATRFWLDRVRPPQPR
jgi:ubiquinone biosynthesis protein